MRIPAILLAFFIVTCAYAQEPKRPYDFYGHGPYRASVPCPSAILGYEAGKTHTTFRDQERVLFAIAAAAKDRVKVVDYGTSVEGRPLRLVVVTAPENLAKLEEIRTKIAKLADPRTITAADEAKIVASTPSLTWINECIHGDETASFEAGMWTLYTLAASEAPEVKQALRDSVVIINPVFNPDGHERFVVAYNSLAVGSPEGFALEHQRNWAATGRQNHYRFDMNRDKLAQSQPETRQETAAFLQWRPQVYVDQHGQVENYFFPPVAQSVHRQTVRERVNKWNDLFGRANAAAFDSRGWQYVNRERFDLFAPVYLDAWATLAGAIGMTYETDAGGSLARRRRDQTVITFRDGIAHHVESALTTIHTAARNREGLLRDFVAYHRDAIEAGRTDRMKRIVILPGSDPGRLSELASVLRGVGVEVREATAPFESANAHAYFETAPTEAAKQAQFPAGSLLVEMAQPLGRLARAFLEPETDFEPEFVKEQLARKEANERKNENVPKEGYGFYDITAWSLPYAYGLRAYWTEDTHAVASRLLEPGADGKVAVAGLSGGVTGPREAVAFVWRYDRDAAAFLALRLLQEDFRLGVMTRPVRVGGTEWPRGTMVAHVARNAAGLRTRLEALSKELGVEVVGLGSTYGEGDIGGLGSGYIETVYRPNIAVVGGTGVSLDSFGSVWYLLERQARARFTSLDMNALRTADLSRFNVIILPDGFGYFGALGKPGVDRLKEWVSRGGALVGLGRGGTWFTEKDAGLSTATIVAREEKPEEKPGQPSPPASATPTKPDDKKDKKPIELPGAIFRAKVDGAQFLGYGYDSEIAVPLDGATFFKPSQKGANIVTFEKENLRLSGFVWPGNTEKFLANTAYVIDEPAGSGHAILFLSDPTFRAYWTGLRKMFLSAILLGPGRVSTVPIGASD